MRELVEVWQEKFGQTLREFRKKKGITQKDLAKKCRVSQQYISHLESGKCLPTPKFLYMSGVVLGIKWEIGG